VPTEEELKRYYEVLILITVRFALITEKEERIVSFRFLSHLKELLAMHVDSMLRKQALILELCAHFLLT
jgi:hypothetical protein